MGDSENKSEKAEENESKRIPPPLDTNEQSVTPKNEKNFNLEIDTSNTMEMPQQSQNTGSQKISNVTNKPESILSSSVNVIPQHYQPRSSNGAKRNELPTDTRPERTQRPEDLKRAQYLTSASEIDVVDTEDNKKVKNNTRKPPTCWVTTSWILTWWAPPFMLRTFGK